MEIGPITIKMVIKRGKNTKTTNGNERKSNRIVENLKKEITRSNSDQLLSNKKPKKLKKKRAHKLQIGKPLKFGKPSNNWKNNRTSSLIKNLEIQNFYFT